jgi:hypothetical protein
MPTPEQFFEGSPTGLVLYQAVADAISSIGPAEVRVTKSAGESAGTSDRSSPNFR